jgi:hypothetical protein
MQQEIAFMDTPQGGGMQKALDVSWFHLCGQPLQLHSQFGHSWHCFLIELLLLWRPVQSIFIA